MVVSDASPLINLARLKRLDLLRRLYEAVLIPEAVWQEVVVRGQGQPGAKEVQEAEWMSVQTVSNRPLVQALRQDLDAGEAEAIAPALETDIEFLLIDERFGRASAQRLGVRCVGVVGVLLEAKQQGLISALQPWLDALRAQAGFYLSETLYARVLKDEGES